MSDHGKMNKIFVKGISAEIVTVFLMLIIPFILGSVNTEVEQSLGDPSGVGFGWGLIFGGWSLYLPMFYIVLALLVAYAFSIVYRILFFKMYIEDADDESNYSFLLIVSSIVYAFVPLLVLISLTNIQIIVVGVLFGITDVMLRLYCYSKLSNQNEGKREK